MSRNSRSEFLTGKKRKITDELFRLAFCYTLRDSHFQLNEFAKISFNDKAVTTQQVASSFIRKNCDLRSRGNPKQYKLFQNWDIPKS